MRLLLVLALLVSCVVMGCAGARPGHAGFIYAEDWGVRADGAIDQAQGVATGTDNGPALAALRDYLKAQNPRHVTIVFPPGQVNSSVNYWLRGVMNATVEAYGTRFVNVGPGRWAADAATLNVNGDYFFNCDTAAKGSANGALAYDHGCRFRTCAVGDPSVTLIDAGDAAKFRAGTYALLFGYFQQNAGYPVNPRFHEVKRIASVEHGVVTFTDRVRARYREDWPDLDYAEGRLHVGAARILPLTRSVADGFQVAESITIEGAAFIHNPAFRGRADEFETLDHGGDVLLTGCLDARMVDCTMGYLDPSMCENIQIERCRVGSTEVDKVISRCRFQDCDIGTMAGGTGADRLEIRGGRISDRFEVMSALTLLVDGVEIDSVRPTTPRCLCRLGNCLLATFRDCTFRPTATDDRSMSGYLIGESQQEEALPPVTSCDGLDAGGITRFRVPYSDAAAMPLWPGRELVCREAPAKTGVVREVYREGSDLVILALMTGQPAAGEVYRYSRCTRIDYDSSNYCADPRWPVFNKPRSHDIRAASWSQREAVRRIEFVWAPWDDHDDPSISLAKVLSVHGTLKSVELMVSAPYTGPGPGKFLYLRDPLSGDRLLSIDLTRVGERRILAHGIAGAVAADSLGTGLGFRHLDDCAVTSDPLPGGLDHAPTVSIVLEAWRD